MCATGRLRKLHLNELCSYCLAQQLDSVLCSKDSCVYLCGDFNDRTVDDWTSLHCNSDLKLGLVTLSDEYNLSQLVTVPTRGPNILDLLFTNCPETVKSLEVIDSFDDLDHKIILATLSFKFDKRICFERQIRKYTSQNLNQLCNALKLVPWQALLGNEDTVDDMVTTFYLLLNKEIDICIPPFTVIIRPRDKPGMNAEVRGLLRRSQRLNRIAKRSGLVQDKLYHIQARRAAKKAWSKARKDYYNKLFSDSEVTTNPTKLQWQKIKLNFKYNSKTNSIPILIDSSGIVCISDTDKVNCLNKHFAPSCQTDFEEVADCSFSDNIQYATESRLSVFNVSESEIFAALRSLDTSKASGPDCISNVVLVSCAQPLSYPLFLIVNKSFETGVFPAQWKYANVTPVYKKKGDAKHPENYRPISLLSSFSKIVESLVHKQLYTYCMENRLLVPYNSGFKKGDSAINQLVHVTNIIYSGFDKGLNTAVIYLDFKSAFDSVWHAGLLYKIGCLGLEGASLLWLTNYLSGRKQKVVLNGYSSGDRNISSGVPQGSILGPLLFLIFINDLAEGLLSDPFLYADDATLALQYKSTSLAEVLLNYDLVKLQTWADNWKMKFNYSKTKLINYSLRSFVEPSLSLNFGGCIIVPCLEHKHLGVIFTPELKWSVHIRACCSKVNKNLGLLRRQARNLTRLQREKIYLSIIRPKIEYGSVIYNNCSLGDGAAIEKLQRRAALIVLGAIGRTETVSLLQVLNWDPLSVRRRVTMLVLLFTIIKNIAPSYLRCNINLSTRAITHNTRRAEQSPFQIGEICTRLSCYKTSFFPNAIKIWNSLSLSIISSNTVNEFKTKLKLYFNLYDRSTRNEYLMLSKSGKLSNIIFQMRLGLSSLHLHLFKYNINDNPFCPSCGLEFESVEHYFVGCFKYNDERATLQNAVSCILKMYLNRLQLILMLLVILLTCY